MLRVALASSVVLDQGVAIAILSQRIVVPEYLSLRILLASELDLH